MEILLYILLTLMLAAVAMLTVMLVRQSKAEERIVDRLMEELEDDQRELRILKLVADILLDDFGIFTQKFDIEHNCLLISAKNK